MQGEGWMLIKPGDKVQPDKDTDIWYDKIEEAGYSGVVVWFLQAVLVIRQLIN